VSNNKKLFALLAMAKKDRFLKSVLQILKKDLPCFDSQNKDRFLLLRSTTKNC